ncbi:50S ribosomal protein L21 [bacterium]|nr:50S ribosomal protein L21 [bacterium]
MYAIVEIGGMQCKAQESGVIRVPRMDWEAGKTVTLDKVLLLVDGERIEVGRPVLQKAQVEAVVLGHAKAKKVIVFKIKRKKNYRVLKGHRQDYTELRIDRIIPDRDNRTERAEQPKPVKPAVQADKAAKSSRKAAPPEGKKTQQAKKPRKPEPVSKKKPASPKK